MIRILSIISLGVMLVFAVACDKSRKNAQTEPASDREISEAVEQKLKAHPDLTSADISATTEDGVVTLRGKVIGQAEADRALEVARTVPNVKNVYSEIRIDRHLTNEDVNERLDESRKNAEAQKEAAEPDNGNLISDAALAAKVKMKLGEDRQVSAYRIDVDAKDGVITLNGRVKNEQEARRAIEIAELVENVKKVTSVLTISD